MPQDTSAPEFETLNLSYQADENRFYITARIVDDASGVQYKAIYCQNPSQTITKGTNLDLNNATGLYEGYIKLDEYAENGEWDILYLHATDIAGNSKSYYPNDTKFPQNISGSLTVTGNQLSDTTCLLYTSPSPRDGLLSRMPSSA